MNLDRLRGNRDLLFWGLHTLGWSTYGLAQYVGAAVYETKPGYVQVVADRGSLGLRAVGAATPAVSTALDGGSARDA